MPSYLYISEREPYSLDIELILKALELHKLHLGRSGKALTRFWYTEW